MRLRTAAALLALSFAAACGGSEPPPPPAPPPGPAEAAIQASALTAHLRFLSSDLLEGRAPATRGGELATEYLATQLALLGVQPAGDGGTYFQQVPVVESTVSRNFSLSVPGTSYRYGRDIVAFSGVEDARVHVQGEVVFVGHGIVAPEANWNDYAGVNVKGKWVLVMVNDPPATADEPDLFGGPALTYYGRWTYKYEEAARQGAAGAILIHTDESATYPWQVVESSWSGTQYSLPPEPGAPALKIKAWMTNDAATDLVRRGGRSLDDLRASAMTRGFKPVTLDLRAAADLTQRSARKTSPNVIGVIPGANAAEGVVFTSHWDHFGMRDALPGDAPDADRIFNGAYDNASGCAGLLEIAAAMAHAGAQPARSMYFVFTTAEEAGLLGSEYFAQHPPLPLDRMAANINVDGINYLGPSKDLVLLGAERSSLGSVAAALAAERGRTIGGDQHPERGYFFRSDHFPLAKGGVPAVSISEPREFVGADAEARLAKQEAYNSTDYHQPSDEYDPAWDFSGAVEDLRFLAQMAWRIAATPEMPAYNEGDQFRNVRAGS
ncbi:MAG: M20/M25/M40 family metallo-hydrolase [Vicinamibacterales bacterium]